jgi:transcriptional regulator with XRE-family HTH domain
MYSRPGVEQLRRIAGALGVGLTWLIGEEGAEQKESGEEGALGEMQVNLRTIGRLDPAALESLAEIIAAVKEKVERERGWRRRG